MSFGSSIQDLYPFLVINLIVFHYQGSNRRQADSPKILLQPGHCFGGDPSENILLRLINNLSFQYSPNQHDEEWSPKTLRERTGQPLGELCRVWSSQLLIAERFDFHLICTAESTNGSSRKLYPIEARNKCSLLNSTLISFEIVRCTRHTTSLSQIAKR